ncbi:MAG: MBL fold metallo-hydrolase [Candidatus Gottesmanbacteria bacterium]
MKIEKLVVGQLATNCYLCFDDINREAVVIDPGDDAQFILNRLQDLKLHPKTIIATHGHFDHVLGTTELKLSLNIPFLINEKDLFLIKQAKSSAHHFLGIKVDPVILPDQFIKEGDLINFGSESLRVLETPGHTPGGISLIGNKIVFTGDTLFADGVGRTDFSYSSKDDLTKSIKRLQKIQRNYTFYPGHGDSF